MSSLSEILNYHPVDNRIFTSGQPNKRQFKIIGETGCAAVVNLAMPNAENAVEDEYQRVTALGMSYLHIPVRYDTPAPEHLRQFFGVMEVFENQKIWVHCAMNYRVSAFIYQYLRLQKNYSKQDAKSQIWPDFNPNQVWQDFMELEIDIMT